MKFNVSIPDDLAAFAGQEAHRQQLSLSGFFTQLLQAERVREQSRRHLDLYGWDVVDDEAAWREYQRRRVAEEYSDDQW